MEQHEISEVTRRAIIDFLTVSNISWAGRLQEDEFLGRLYNLADTPSTDSRIGNAAGDIIQHRHSFNDWADDWVFYDPRFNLLRATDGEFLRFLCETVHPVIRPDADDVRMLVAQYNTNLSTDGWCLVKAQEISGKAVFTPQKSGQRVQLFDEPTGWEKVERQIKEARDALRTAETEEHYQSVGLFCRESLISLAQEVYNPEYHSTSDSVVPSNTNAQRMLEAFFNAELTGHTNEQTRAYAKAALKLAVALQHKRTADSRTGALCLEATASTVNVVAILAKKGFGF